MNRGCLGKRSSDLTSLPTMSTLIYGYRLSGGGGSLNKNSMRGCRGGRHCKLSSTKKALHGCGHGNKKLLSSRTIYRKRLGLILEEKKRGEEDMKIKIIFFGTMRKPKVYGKLVNGEMYLQFKLIEHNGMGG